MQLPNDNRLILAVGAGLAILAAVVLALVFMGGDNSQKVTIDEPDTNAGLTVDVSDAPELQPSRELRCFVDGQFVGMATLVDCARRNGLATDGLDVGLDATGNLAAAPTASLAPPPALPQVDAGADNPEPVEGAGSSSPPSVPDQRVQRAAGAPCLRHAGSEWRQLSGNLSLNECVQALYAGVCVRPGEAQYGRHGNLTLRLVPRRVEQSNDNSRFRVLAEQDRACQFPDLG
jgi:hypothetical protein